MNPFRRPQSPYKLAYTPEAVERLSLMDARQAQLVNTALHDVTSKGWTVGVERIERNKYRLKLPKHHLLFRVFDDQTLVLVEFVGRRSEVVLVGPAPDGEARHDAFEGLGEDETEPYDRRAPYARDAVDFVAKPD